jgi:predicted MFS family arabinose efflux permease
VAVACGEWCRVGPEPVARSPGLLTKGAPRLIRHGTRVPAGGRNRAGHRRAGGLDRRRAAAVRRRCHDAPVTGRDRPDPEPVTAPAADATGCTERAAPLVASAAGVPCRPLVPEGVGERAASPEESASRLALVLGGLFALAGSGSSAAAVALPAVGADLDVSPGATAWALSGYVLALAVTTAVYGRLADVAGVRRPLLAGGGLMAGGALLESSLGWRAVLALPATGLLLLPLVAPSASRRGQGGRFDLLGAGLVVAFASGVVLLVQSAANGAVVAVVGVALLAVSGPAAVLHVRRRPDGFLPRRVISARRPVFAALCAAVVPAGWFGLLLVVPTELAARGWSTLLTGAVLVPAAAAGLVGSRYAGRLLDRLGGFRSLALASALTTLALVLAAARLPVLLAAAVAVVSAAFSLGQPALIRIVSAAVPAADRGVALGVATLLFLLGGGVGTATVAGIGAVAGPSTGLLALAACPALATVLAWRRGRAEG